MYCVYITTYSGSSVLPKKYIGSTSLKRIREGYLGSVRSRKWRQLWEEETKVNPSTFDVSVVSIHTNRKSALEEELRLQQLYDVVKSPDWINEAYAQVRGYAGRDVSGANNPMYGQGYKQQAWCRDNPEKASDRNRKAALTQWSNIETRSRRIKNMTGRPKTRKSMSEDEFRELQLQKSLKSATITCDKIEYNGVVYNGWRNLLELTGVTKHLYRKYYVNGCDPLQRKGANGPKPKR